MTQVLIMIGGTLAVLAVVFALIAVAILLSPFVGYYGSIVFEKFFDLAEKWNRFAYELMEHRKINDDEWHEIKRWRRW